MSNGFDLGGLSLIIGLGLIIFPEPATTATGIALVGATFGLSALQGNGD